MGTCIQPITARSPRRLVRLAAAAVTGFTARSAAAAPPVDPGAIEAEPRTPYIRSSYQTWVAFTAQGPIHDPLLMFVDLVGGFHADMHPANFTVRPALGLRLPHGFSVFAGYSYSSFWGADHDRGEEHVAFQQVAYKAPISAVDLFGRVRVEERFRPGSDVGYRLRTLALLNVPLWRQAPVQAVLAVEAFLGLNQPAFQPQLMDLALFFAGIGWSVNPHFRVEAGYQAALVPRPIETEVVHCLSIGTIASW